MNMLKLFLNALEPRLKVNNRFPITIDSLATITRLPRRFISVNLKSDEDIKIWKRQGVYTEVEILKELKVPKFIIMNLAGKELKLLTKLYESNISKEEFERLNYKNSNKYNLTNNDFYYIKEIINKGYENIFGITNEKIDYKLSDDVLYDTETEKYIYKVEKEISEKTRDDSELDIFVKDKIKCLKDSARKRNIFFDLIEDDLKIMYERQEGNCYFSKRKMSFKSDNVKYAISVDRLDSNKGYTKTNTVFCLNIVNSMKSNLELNEFLDIVRDISVNFKDPV
jgi:hypothetical protein